MLFLKSRDNVGWQMSTAVKSAKVKVMISVCIAYIRWVSVLGVFITAIQFCRFDRCWHLPSDYPEINSPKGHKSYVFHTQLFSPPITNFERVCPFCYVLKAIMIIMFFCTYDLIVHIVLTTLTSFRSEWHECTLVLYVLKCLSVQVWVSAFMSPTTNVGWQMSTEIKLTNI